MNAVENAPQSQVEVTCELAEIAAQMPDVRTPADLGLLRDALLAHLTFRSYNEASWEHERSIRWKRTATEILSDGWVYEAKGCTDIVIAFIGLCRAKGLATRFVKVRSNTGKTHSLAEVYHSGAWWLVETVAPGMAPIGEMKEETPYKIWRLWRRGLDAWSIGLKEAQKPKEIFAVTKMIIFDYGRTLYDRETNDFFPNAISVVKTLAEKYRLSIVSVSPADEEETRIEALRELGILDHFEEIVFTESGEAKSKEYEALLRKVGLKAHEVVVVDDYIIRGIAWGNAAGATTVWFQNGKFADLTPNDETGDPDFTIHSLSEVLKVLKLQ